MRYQRGRTRRGGLVNTVLHHGREFGRHVDAFLTVWPCSEDRSNVISSSISFCRPSTSSCNNGCIGSGSRWVCAAQIPAARMKSCLSTWTNFCKLIVDSRHADAGASSSFEISLPETLSLPHNAVGYVCNLQVTNTLSSTDKHKNTFYWIEQALGQHSLNRVFLTNKPYTPESLATELQTKMNESSVMRPTPGYVVTFEEDLGALKIHERQRLTRRSF